MKKRNTQFNTRLIVTEQSDRNALLMAFRHVAGQIVDRQIEWTPGQNGRWDIPALQDTPSGVPQIKFSGFPAETILTLRSANHSVVKLGLDAAALAISVVAWNWVVFQSFEAGKHDYGRKAEEYFKALHYHIFRSRKSGVTKDEEISIHRYID